MARLFDAPIIAHDGSLDRLLQAPVPVMLFFWQDHQVLAPYNKDLLALASREAGQLIVAKINARENPIGMQRFAVDSTPLAIGLHAGREIARVHVARPDDLNSHVAQLLGRSATGPAAHQPAAAGHLGRPVHVTDATFEREVLASSLPVLVDFWAPWCAPCQMIAPALDAIARNYAGRLQVVKVNVDQSPHYAGVYGVQGIPTLMIFKHGQLSERLVGMMPASHIQAVVERHLG